MTTPDDPPTYTPAPFPSLSITPSIPTSALFDLIACIVFAILALFFVTLRVISRIKQGGKLYANDWCIFWAMFWGLFLAVNSIVAVLYGGVGHHMVDIMRVVPERVEGMLKVRRCLISQCSMRELQWD